LTDDPPARVACETLVTAGLFASGRNLTRHTSTFPTSSPTVHRIGYGDTAFTDSKCAVISTIDRQSPDIAQGVDTAALASGTCSI
jgi:S-adenosylmethionine synthetase